jgi:hypothetical protein
MRESVGVTDGTGRTEPSPGQSNSKRASEQDGQRTPWLAPAKRRRYSNGGPVRTRRSRDG